MPLPLRREICAKPPPPMTQCPVMTSRISIVVISSCGALCSADAKGLSVTDSLPVDVCRIMFSGMNAMDSLMMRRQAQTTE